MPITLEKLFSPTATVSFPFLGETVNVTFAPWKYTGEMQDLLDRLQRDQAAEQTEMAELIEQAVSREGQAAALDPTEDAEAITELQNRAAELRADAKQHEVRLDHRDKAALRDVLSTLLVSWDVLDGKDPIPTTKESLNALPDVFLWAVFLSLNQENQPDPTPAPKSSEPSSLRTTALSPTGSRSSSKRKLSASRPSPSTSGQNGRSAILSGEAGR